MYISIIVQIHLESRRIYAKKLCVLSPIIIVVNGRGLVTNRCFNLSKNP